MAMNEMLSLRQEIVNVLHPEGLTNQLDYEGPAISILMAKTYYHIFNDKEKKEFIRQVYSGQSFERYNMSNKDDTDNFWRKRIRSGKFNSNVVVPQYKQ